MSERPARDLKRRPSIRGTTIVIPVSWSVWQDASGQQKTPECRRASLAFPLVQSLWQSFSHLPRGGLPTFYPFIMCGKSAPAQTPDIKAAVFQILFRPGCINSIFLPDAVNRKHIYKIMLYLKSGINGNTAVRNRNISVFCWLDRAFKDCAACCERNAVCRCPAFVLHLQQRLSCIGIDPDCHLAFKYVPRSLPVGFPFPPPAYRPTVGGIVQTAAFSALPPVPA